MSLGVVIKGTEGIVLAVDSRVTLEAHRPNTPPIPVNFDNTSKLLSFSDPHNFVGAVTYGAAVIGRRTAHSFVPEFEQNILAKKYQKRTDILTYANELSDFFMARWKESMPDNYRGPDMTFIVGGYDPKAPYGKVFLLGIPNRPKPEPRNPGKHEFGMTWGGQLQIASRIVHGFDPALVPIIRKTLNLDRKQTTKLVEDLRKRVEFPIPYDVLPLQDCVDLAIFLIRSTMSFQRLAVGVRGVGGPIEVAVITRTKSISFIQKKDIHGEFI
jgi:hypothetical protein